MSEIKYVMWNCSGTLPTSSIDKKIDFLESVINTNFDILILIETHHKHDTDIPTRLLRYKHTYHFIQTKACESDPYAGMIVLINKKFKILRETPLLSGRLINIKIKSVPTNKEYNITLLYGYTTQHASQKKMKNITEKLMENHEKCDQNIILGDFNFVDNDLDRVREHHQGMNQMDRTLSSPWVELTNKLDITDPFRENNPKRRMFSYIHTQRKAKSRIDRVYVNYENTANVIHYKHTPTPFNMTHRILSFTYVENSEKGPSYWKMNTSILHDPPYQKTVQKIVQDVHNLNVIDPIEKWLIFIETIRIDTQIYCTKKKISRKQN